MWNRAYFKRLQRDLPVWIARGWVTEAGQSAILDSVASGTAGTRRASLAFATLGVLLVGTGIILFFAANWDGMSKLAKLVVLFCGMWGVYLAAGWSLARPDRIAGGFAQSLLLLGTILFGANINLIAQAYHISGHYPNAILLWALGGLAVAWLARSQPAAVLGLLVLTLWSGMETFGGIREHYHWPFVAVWALFLPPIVLRAWRFAAGTAMLSILLWHLVLGHRFYSLVPGSLSLNFLLMAEAALIAAVGLMLVGVMMEWHARLNPLANVVQRYSVIAILLNLLMLTQVRSLPHISHTFIWELKVVSVEWKVGMLVALAAVAAFGLFVVRLNRGRWVSGNVRTGLCVFAAVAALIAVSLFVGSFDMARTVVGIGFNLCYYASLLWLIFAGYRRGDVFRVNVGFVFFVMGIVYLYFDRFWSLMDRSVFFVVGGLLLCIGGYVLETQRRRLHARLGHADEEGESS